MSTNLLDGVRYLWTGVMLLGRPKIRRFVLVPLAINCLLFTGAMLFGAHWLETLTNEWLRGGWEWLRWLLWPLFIVLALAFVFFFFSIVANLIGAPFNGMLAEAVEVRLTNQSMKDKRSGLFPEALLAISGELHKLTYFALWGIPLLVLFLVPIVQLAAPFLWFLFGAWTLALEYADYPMGNHGMSLSQQRKTLASRRTLTMGFGIAVMAMTMTPVINFLAMPAAVAGATAMWAEQFRANPSRQ